MTNELFTQCIGLLQAQFGKMPDERVRGLYVALDDLTDEQFKMAVKKIIRSFSPTSARPFPVPADFIEAAGISAEQEAKELMGLIQEAVFSVGSYRSVDFGSPELHGVIQRFGGWPAICQWDKKDWSINEGRFLTCLEHAIDNCDRGPEYLRGIAEANNGDLKYAGLCHIGRAMDGKVLIKNGLHPNTKFLPRSNELRFVDNIADKFDMNKALKISAA